MSACLFAMGVYFYLKIQVTFLTILKIFFLFQVVSQKLDDTGSKFKCYLDHGVLLFKLVGSK